MRCKATTRVGTQCRMNALAARRYCHVHCEKVVETNDDSPPPQSLMNVWRRAIMDVIVLVTIAGTIVLLALETYRETLQIVPIATPKSLATQRSSSK